MARALETAEGNRRTMLKKNEEDGGMQWCDKRDC